VGGCKPLNSEGVVVIKNEAVDHHHHHHDDIPRLLMDMCNIK